MGGLGPTPLVRNDKGTIDMIILNRNRSFVELLVVSGLATGGFGSREQLHQFLVLRRVPTVSRFSRIDLDG